MGRDQILFIYTSFSSFVKTDYEILNESYSIKQHKYIEGKSLGIHAKSQFFLLIWLLKNIWNSKTVYIWFADYHSFLPILFSKFFNKKSFIVLGGYDVTYLPEINYGSFNNPFRAFLTKFSINNASLNLAVCDNIKDEALDRVPNARIKIVYTGYSDKKFTMGNKEKLKQVLSVAGGDTLQRIKIKGGDFFLELAKRMDSYKFIIVGGEKESIEKYFSIPPNVEVISTIPQEKLIDLFRDSKIYAQFSLREGLPNSVCEAMLCGCLPIGMNAGGIPVAIGEAGYILNDRNLDEAKDQIESMMELPIENSEKSRERIRNNFTLEKRKKTLKKIIEQTGNYINEG